MRPRRRNRKARAFRAIPFDAIAPSTAAPEATRDFMLSQFDRGASVPQARAVTGHVNPAAPTTAERLLHLLGIAAAE